MGDVRTYVNRECPHCAASHAEDGMPVAMVEFDRLTAEVERLREALRQVVWAENRGAGDHAAESAYMIQIARAALDG